ncbi:hypothetical protein [Flammeovirga sp. OC4]|uniref:hypothetical protein n=1 Tax=Flammeovirga sp. OC4 TaxID=1382345 RepID=UPI0005C6533B|nr:hypothetical protein [Flammeovirga sp. OC4]
MINIYSGIEPNKKGAGDLVGFFLSRLDALNIQYNLFYISTPDNFLVKLMAKSGLKPLLKKTYYIFQHFFSSNKIQKDSTSILFHPQSLGLTKTVNIINSSSKVYIYVLDNFFFCIKSYNSLYGKECLKCIENKNSHFENKCNFFPVKYRYDEHALMIKTIKEKINSITFLCQNINQETLLKKQFGEQISTDVIGMNNNIIIREKDNNSLPKRYDFCYHNTLAVDKGILFFIELAERYQEYSFFIPYSRKEVESITTHTCPSNIEFKACNWNNGLKDAVIHSKIIVCPSLWSAPVEGALLKSINYNGCVAVKKNMYSFSQELSSILIELNDKLSDNDKPLSNIINNKESRKKLVLKSKDWLKNYEKMTYEKFDEILLNL